MIRLWKYHNFMDNTIILYHGSNKIIKKPVYGAGKRYNDYGSGFYCTQDLNLAKEWAVSENQDGYAQDFLNNAISLRKLSRAMHLGKLELQTVLKSERAFAQITFQQAFLAENKKWMPQKMARDSRARQEYFSSGKEPRKPGDIYMLQILDEEMKADDPRIR